MTNEVKAYQTNDGNQHETEEKAKQHELYQVSEIFDKKLKDQGWLDVNERCKIIDNIFDSHEEARRIYGAMKEILSERDERTLLDLYFG